MSSDSEDSSNILLKYADDTYLIVPAPNSALTQHELDHVSQWDKTPIT